LTFSEEVLPRAGGLTVRGDGFEKTWDVEGASVTVEGKTLTASFADGEQLLPNPTYEVLVDVGFVWDYPWHNPSEESGVVGIFRTIADVRPPTLLRTVPAGLTEAAGEDAFMLPLALEWEFDEDVVLLDGACVSSDARYPPWRIEADGVFLRAELDARLVQEELVICEYTIADEMGNSQSHKFSLLAWPEEEGAPEGTSAPEQLALAGQTELAAGATVPTVDEAEDLVESTETSSGPLGPGGQPGPDMVFVAVAAAGAAAGLLLLVGILLKARQFRASRQHREENYGPQNAKSPIRDGWVTTPESFVEEAEKRPTPVFELDMGAAVVDVEAPPHRAEEPEEEQTAKELSTLQWLDEVALGNDVPALSTNWPPPPHLREARPPSAALTGRATALAPPAPCDLPKGARKKSKSKIRRPTVPPVLGELI
jgi:hypothetical protein